MRPGRPRPRGLRCEGHHRSDADRRIVWRRGYGAGDGSERRALAKLAIVTEQRTFAKFAVEPEQPVVGALAFGAFEPFVYISPVVA
jgi:hypothetical protein